MLVALFFAMLIAQQPMPLVLTLDVSPETLEGQRQVALAAIEACGGRYPQIGRYTFEGRSGLGAEATRFTYRGEVTCIDGPPPQPMGGVPVAAGWQAEAADEARAREATLAFLAATDRGDSAALDAMMAESLGRVSTPEQRAEALRSFVAEAGAPGTHRILRTTWYVNPTGVAPGAYAAVDFDRSYANFSASCGYVVWHRQADGSLLMVRQETGNAPRAAGGSAEALAQVRRLLQCRD